MIGNFTNKLYLPHCCKLLFLYIFGFSGKFANITPISIFPNFLYVKQLTIVKKKRRGLYKKVTVNQAK